MDSIKKLKDLFVKFPTIGSRTAGRFAFYLLHASKQEVDDLVKAMQELKNNVKLCAFCFNPHEPFNTHSTSSGQAAQGKGETNLCHICFDASRNKELLCIVEKETDLLSIENTKQYKGLYFILGGTLTLRKTDGANLRIEELKDRIKKSSFSEIIIALNPTPEGKSTSVLVERALKEVIVPTIFKITHLAQGLPVGGELEYADQETLESAFEGRK